MEKEYSIYSSIQRPQSSPKWVTNLAAAENARQLVVVAGVGGTAASVSMHEKNGKGEWQQILSTPGYIGKKGLCKDSEHKEGAAATPIGVYHFNKAFGIADDPGCAIPYVKVNDNTYWSGDYREHYNEMVDIRDYPDLDLTYSEHLIEYEYQYRYCLNISFNEEGVPERGSAIFLHCLSTTKPYTGGCVAIPENIMRLVMQRVKPECVIVIDTLEEFGGSL